MFNTIKSTFSRKITIFKILAIFIMTGTAFLNLYSQSVTIDMAISHSNWNFGHVVANATGANHNFIVTNLPTSTAPLTVSFNSLPAPFSIFPSGAITIPVGQSQSFSVTFRPTAVYDFNQPWPIINNSTNLPHPYVIPLTGKGIAANINMSVSTKFYDFGSFSINSNPKPIYDLIITNLPTSTGPLTVSWTSYPKQFSINSPSSNPIPVGQSRTYRVTFNPIAAVKYSQVWNINNNSTNLSHPVQIMFVGNGRLF